MDDTNAPQPAWASVWRKARRSARLAVTLAGTRRIPWEKRWRMLSQMVGNVPVVVTEETVSAVVHGVRLEIPRALVTPRIETAIREGVYEACEILAFDEIARDGDRVLEIGTGLGFLAAYMAKDARVRAVVSVEANPALVPVAEHIFALNGMGVRVRHEAVGETVGTARFALHPDFWASSIETWEGAATIEVPMRPLDEVVCETGANLVVVDIEGAEYRLLPACRLPGVDKLLLELHPWQADAARTETLLAALRDLGFRHETHLRWGNVHAFTRSPISHWRPTPPRSPQHAIGCATPTSSADRMLLTPRPQA